VLVCRTGPVGRRRGGRSAQNATLTSEASEASESTRACLFRKDVSGLACLVVCSALCLPMLPQSPVQALGGRSKVPGPNCTNIHDQHTSAATYF
jgi:hypothetical protein